MRPSSFVATLALAACGASDLTRLGTAQRALEDVVALRSTVDELRAEMQKRGVIKGGPHGPRSPGAGAVAPNATVDEDLPHTVARVGGDLSVKPVGGAERRDDTGCGWRIGLHHLEPIGDTALSKDNLGTSSPVVVRQAGRDLKPHAQPADYEKGCGAAFRHKEKYLFYSPDGSADAGSEPLELALSSELPMLDGDGRPRFWVYPGTTLEVRYSGAWDAESWGEPSLVFDLRLRAVGTAAQPTEKGRGEVVIRYLDRELRGSDANWRGSEALPGDVTDLVIAIESPADGPFVLVDALAVGNPGFASVVTSKQQPGDEP